MESYQSIAVSQQDELRWIILNRPRALNSFDLVQWNELEDALRALTGLL
jgi:enoyl-CoA hydratase/carnithine racemase